MPSFNPNPTKVSVPVYRVYLLINDETFKMYVGFTNNIERRIRQHQNGETPSSAILGPHSALTYAKSWVVRDKETGLKLERKLKLCVKLRLLTWKNFRKFDIRKKVPKKYEGKYNEFNNLIEIVKRS